MTSTIRFLRSYHRREIGSIDTGMGYGVHDTLVRRGIAEFVQEAKPVVAAAISEPVAETEPIRAKRRSHSKEPV